MSEWNKLRIFMHIFSDTPGDFTFNGCSTCQECCSGQRFVLAPLILEDFTLVMPHFPILLGHIDGELRVFMLFSSGGEPCPYLKDGFCSIYSVRPPACQTYPLTPFNDKILCDTTCPGVQEKKAFPFGTKLVESNGRAGENFYPKRFENFESKLERTRAWLRKVESRLLSLDKKVKGVELFQVDSEDGQDVFVNMHLKSLKNIEIFKNFQGEK